MSVLKSNKDKNVDVAITVDVDAIAGWLGSYGGAESVDDLSRGEFSGRVGSIRMLELFDAFDIKTTWFIPGHTIETFEDNMKKVVERGHEVGAHGYSHEDPTRLTRDKEEKIFKKSIELCQKLSGKRPAGYRGPWDFGPNTIDLLLDHGFIYDSSIEADDFEPYLLRKGDKWYRVDYTKDPDSWMKPYEFGNKTKLLEIPVSWYLDDLPPMMFIKPPNYNYGYTSPNVMYDIYKDHFDYLYDRIGHGVFCMMTHPDVSGRPHVILMLERFIRYVKGFPGVRFRPLEQIASEYLERKH